MNFRFTIYDLRLFVGVNVFQHGRLVSRGAIGFQFRNALQALRVLNRKSSVVNRKFFAGVLAIILAACSAGTPPAQGLHVVAAETWLADIAQNVAGQRVHVDSLLTPGIDPHEYQPAPQDAIKIAQANVLIVNGMGYESWLQNSLQNTGSKAVVVTASDGIFVPGPSDVMTVKPPSKWDPHMWMNPLNVRMYVGNIREALTQADPAGQAVYAANAEAYMAKLNALDTWIHSQVDQIPPERRLLVTNHDSLGYFAAAYGFTVVGAVVPSVTNESSPSAAQMAGLIDTVKRTGAPAIFLDPSENPGLANQIASATSAKVVTDLYVETLSGPNGPAATYIEMLKHDTSVIVEALK